MTGGFPSKVDSAIVRKSLLFVSSCSSIARRFSERARERERSTVAHDTEVGNSCYRSESQVVSQLVPGIQ